MLQARSHVLRHAVEKFSPKASLCPFKLIWHLKFSFNVFSGNGVNATETNPEWERRGHFPVNQTCDFTLFIDEHVGLVEVIMSNPQWQLGKFVKILEQVIKSRVVRENLFQRRRQDSA
ncbi:hypothetical protein RRF57_000398 [Xylaria bambusicola]|uniref:Uncharacterized protein n=1 Tax=Xylaria bambusicola TaxID=326684 RepID=A0AAN7Z0N2_9PEZI